MKTSFLIFLMLIPIKLIANTNVNDYFGSLNSQTPGCAVGVVKEGVLVYEGYFGQANLRYDIPIDKKTVFNVGSISKHITAVLAVQLGEKGLLSLNDSLKKYYPQGPRWFKDVKLHHLIGHQSGLPDYLSDEKTREELVKRASTVPRVLEDLVAGKPIARDIALKHVLDIMMELRAPSFKPGENSSYSNTGYLLLAEIIEKSSGISFSDLAQKQLFKPLKMSSTEVMSLQSVEIPWSATGYSVFDSSVYKYRRNSLNFITQGEGGILTTLPDFARWVAYLINPIDDKLFWSKFLKPFEHFSTTGGFPNFETDDESEGFFMRNILDPLKTDSKLWGAPYNNGLSIRQIKGEAIYSHGGFSLDAMKSYFWFSPGHKIAYIQLCNFEFNKIPTVNEILDIYGD